MDEFVNLHVHSHYSILDGHSKPDELAQRAAELEQPAVAITDHGNLGGALRHYEACTAAGVKPIIGLEAYCAPDSRHHKEVLWWGSPEQRRDDLSGAGKYTHITLFATSARGLRNLYHLHHLSFNEGFYAQPRIDLDALATHGQDLIATTGCPSGAVQTRLRLGQFDEAVKHASDLKDIFGDRLYIELMDHQMDHGLERDVRKDLLTIYRKLDIPLVITADSHYTRAEEADTHDTLLCIQTKAKKSDSDRFRFDGHGYYLRSAREMEQIFGADYRGSIRNSVRIADQVEDYSEAFAYQLRMPTFTGSIDGDANLLREKCIAWINQNNREEDALQMEYELDTVIGMGYPGYFLVLADLMEAGRREGIRFGPGRGSAGGSLIARSLEITQLDPRRHGLLSERFLNPERVSLPDIDIDVDDSKRDRFLSIVRERMGEGCVAQLGTYGTIGAKSALKDSARALGHSYMVGVQLANMLPPAKFGRQPTLAELPKTTDHPTVVATARGIEGTIRNKGVHAAGVIICPENLVDLVPLYRPGGKQPLTTAFDMRDVEKLGLVKYDFLGLATLGVIDECVHLLRRDECASTGGSSFELPKSLDDPRVYDLLSSGETTGIFQLDGFGMRTLLRRLRPSSFGDIAAVLALYRPGPMGANSHNEYADRKNGRSRIVYPHPEYADELATILSQTYGIIVFQEQVLQTLAKVGGYSYASAALIFDAMRKKDTAKMEAAYPDFERRLSERGYSQGAIRALWEVLVPFSDYSFNKSHSIGYGYISYWCAYLKAHHPKEFMCALLSREEDPDKVHEYIRETVRLGIPILPPDVNESEYGWTIVEDGIRFGLGSVRGISAKTYSALARNRPYQDIDDFFGRVDNKFLNIGVLKAAVQAGALDSMDSNRELLLDQIEQLAARAVADRGLDQTGLKRLWGTYRLFGSKPKDLGARRAWEQEVLGIALTQRRIKIKLIERVQENDLYYIRDVVRDHPGLQPIDLVVSELTKVTGIATMDLSGKARKRLEALSVIEIEEE